MNYRTCIVAAALLGQAGAETITLAPDADTGLFEFAPDHNLGASTNLQVGTNSQGTSGRGLFRFPVAEQIPSGSRIDAVRVSFQVTAASSPTPAVHDLVRIQLDWAEGDGSGGQGSDAGAGQATWDARRHGESEWTVPGGGSGTDFAGDVSASASLGGIGAHLFEPTAKLVGDVQRWLDHPGENFGWALVSQDEGTASSTRRIASRELADLAPRLLIDYTPFRVIRIDHDPAGVVELEWQGGAAPFAIERAADPGAQHWSTVASSDSDTANLSGELADRTFYRVVPAAAPQNARYRVTWQATWSRDTHPSDFPGGAHFSALYGATHDASVALWEPGGLATTGIKNMAERGSNSALRGEIQASIDAGSAEHLLPGRGIPSPGETQLEFDISQSHSLVSLVCMIAPSPDWFVGINGLALFDGSQWAAGRTVALQAYDAGTDSGSNYTSGNAVTDPAEPIAHIEPAGESRPFGTLTFERIE